MGNAHTCCTYEMVITKQNLARATAAAACDNIQLLFFFSFLMTYFLSSTHSCFCASNLNSIEGGCCERDFIAKKCATSANFLLIVVVVGQRSQAKQNMTTFRPTGCTIVVINRYVICRKCATKFKSSVWKCSHERSHFSFKAQCKHINHDNVNRKLKEKKTQ